MISSLNPFGPFRKLTRTHTHLAKFRVKQIRVLSLALNSLCPRVPHIYRRLKPFKLYWFDCHNSWWRRWGKVCISARQTARRCHTRQHSRACSPANRSLFASSVAETASENGGVEGCDRPRAIVSEMETLQWRWLNCSDPEHLGLLKSSPFSTLLWMHLFVALHRPAEPALVLVVVTYVCLAFHNTHHFNSDAHLTENIWIQIL